MLCKAMANFDKSFDSFVLPSERDNIPNQTKELRQMDPVFYLFHLERRPIPLAVTLSLLME